MAALRAALLALALLWARPAAADPLDRWSVHTAEASARFGVPVEWIRRVMRAESGGRTALNGRPLVSHAGAMGLMQLMPGTWREMGAALRLGPDPHDPRDNILAGTAYLRTMYDRFGYPGLFAAYNAGPARYARHLATGRGLPAETIAYVAQVVGNGAPAVPRSRERPAHCLFGLRADAPPGRAEAEVLGPSAASRGLSCPWLRPCRADRARPGEGRRRAVGRSFGDVRCRELAPSTAWKRRGACWWPFRRPLDRDQRPVPLSRP
jgi:hypothetical protein